MKTKEFMMSKKSFCSYKVKGVLTDYEVLIVYWSFGWHLTGGALIHSNMTYDMGYDMATGIICLFLN